MASYLKNKFINIYNKKYNELINLFSISPNEQFKNKLNKIYNENNKEEKINEVVDILFEIIKNNFIKIAKKEAEHSKFCIYEIDVKKLNLIEIIHEYSIHVKNHSIILPIAIKTFEVWCKANGLQIQGNGNFKFKISWEK
jgi:hypothetical protein